MKGKMKFYTQKMRIKIHVSTMSSSANNQQHVMEGNPVLFYDDSFS